MTLVRILDEFENCNRDRRKKVIKKKKEQKPMRKIKKRKKNDKNEKKKKNKEKRKKYKKNKKKLRNHKKKKKNKKLKKRSLDKNRENVSAQSESLLKNKIVRILDEFENSFCDRRLGDDNVASRFVCVSCTPLFDC